jgi:AcrR family transcriptional regulator
VAHDTQRRQERGKRRMASILDAASRVFEDVGYDAATMNGIATTAKISPGSLYQFFRSKQAIAEALTARYVAEMKAMHDAALDPNLGRLPLPEMIDRVVDPMVAFHVAHPAAKALLAGADVSAELAATTERLQAAMRERVEDLIAVAVPHLGRRERVRTAQMCVQITKAILPMVLASGPAERRTIVIELKRALVGYLSTVP